RSAFELRLAHSWREYADHAEPPEPEQNRRPEPERRLRQDHARYQSRELLRGPRNDAGGNGLRPPRVDHALDRETVALAAADTWNRGLQEDHAGDAQLAAACAARNQEPDRRLPGRPDARQPPGNHTRRDQHTGACVAFRDRYPCGVALHRGSTARGEDRPPRPE